MTETKTSPALNALIELPVLQEMPKAVEAEAGPSEEAFLTSLTLQAETVPEIVERGIEIGVAGKELINEFAIEPQFFDDRSRSMLFTSLASRHAHNNKREKVNWADHVAEKTFIADTLFLLAKDHSSVLENAKELHNKQKQEDAPELSEQGLKELFDKFSDPKLSEEVKAEAIRTGLFEEVSDKLGLSSDLEGAKVEVRVLSIGADYAYSDFDYEAAHLSREEAMEWARGLKIRTNNFAAGFSEGELAASAAGFATSFGGKEYIYIPQARAEVYLAENHGVPLNEDGKKKAAKTKGLLQHEYTHTREDVKVGAEFGSTIEERRAEYFSGDTSEYYDVKQFFNQLAALRGVHIIQMFEQQVESRREGVTQDIYELVAANYGLDETIEIATMQPLPYRRLEKSGFAKAASDYLGSYEDIVERITKSLTPEEKELARARVDEKKKVMLAGPEPSQFLIDYVGGYYEPIEKNL